MRFLSFFLLILLCGGMPRVYAQQPENDSLPSLNELLEMKVDSKEDRNNAPVSVAGQKNQLIQEVPSIISVITKEDIANYGARDISEALRMVPGFEFGWDVEGLTGLSFRGIWVHEGKALIMINGVAINDLAFGNTNLIGTVQTSMIERIEIIRGPGSVIYGGFAEATVINIVTHSGSNLKGVTGTVSGGLFGSNSFSKSGNLNCGFSNKNGQVSASVGYANQPLSTRTYTDFFGNTLEMNLQNAYREYMYAIVKGNYKDFSFVYHRSTQNYAGQDGDIGIIPLNNNRVTEAYTNFTEALVFKQQISCSSVFSIEPSVSVVHGNGITSALLPNSQSNGVYGLDGDTKMYRYQAGIMSNWDIKKYGQVIFGGSFIRDQLNIQSITGNPGLRVGPGPGDTAYAANSDMKSILAEYTNKFDVFGITVGGRYEITSFGNAFAPRAGITYVYKKFNAKLLFGDAYRIPLLYEASSRTINYSGNLHPETSTSIELETGYKFSRLLSARVNIFNIEINSPIKYDGSTNAYVNTGHVLSHGAEGEVNFQKTAWGGFANGSLALPGSGTSPTLLTADKKEFLGVPQWKLNAGAYYNYKNLQVSPSFTLLPRRLGQSSDTASLSNTTYPSVLLLNLSVTYTNLFKKTDVRLTGTNLLDEKYELIQTYYGDHAAVPAYDRHITLSIIAKF